jgi:phage baseplate assembly protein W
MAFGAKKIFPLDTKPGTGIGLSLPFNAPGVFKTTYTTKETVKYNLINFFLTNQNERYLNPTFGGNLRAFVFQQISEGNLDSLKEDIQSQLSNNFPSVIVSNLDIDSLPEFNQINVVLTYNIADTGLNDTIQLAFT